MPKSISIHSGINKLNQYSAADQKLVLVTASPPGLQTLITAMTRGTPTRNLRLRTDAVQSRQCTAVSSLLALAGCFSRIAKVIGEGIPQLAKKYSWRIAAEAA